MILSNIPPDITAADQMDIFVSSINSMFAKLNILTSLFDTIYYMMNQITELDTQDIKDFGIMCQLFGVFWRKCNLNVTPKVHIVESHLVDTMKRFGRVGLFNENPIERVHIENKHWAGVLASFKSWDNLVALRNKRKNVRMINKVHGALQKYSDFRMRKSILLQDDSRNTHKLYDELMQQIEIFKTDSNDIDDQFMDNMPVHDMEGLEEVDQIVDEDTTKVGYDDRDAP